ncbi:MAG: AMP-binding protein [Fusobacterium sp.]|nr:AMP-binding protein [Fusobacterium sp.]
MGLRSRYILSLLEDKTCDYEDRVALGIKEAFGWKEFTYKGLGLLSRKLGRYLIEEVAVSKGERVAILSESKPEYGACVFASILAGTITVPLDIKLTEYELKSILTDAEPVVLLVSAKYLEIAKNIQAQIPSLKHIIVIDEHFHEKNTVSIYELPDIYNAKWRKRSSKATAFIIYTSGTTGSPKGVEISFKNITSQLEDLQIALSAILPNRKIKTLSILPMNHLFEMTVGFSAFLNFGFSVYYSHSLKPKDILSVMREKQIEFMIVVPAFLKLLKCAIENELKNSSKFSQYAFSVLYSLARFVPFYSVKKLMFKKIHDQFGGRFIGCISGGAPLDVSVGKFFETIGIKVYQGYGLSETSPVVSVNTDKRGTLSSVGRPLKQFEARIDKETGELQLRGPSVMKGYRNQPELTAETIDSEGWLHTGDIAKFDKDGHIYITGRIKNMIVLSGGKKVFPEEVESVLEKSKYISEVCVLGSQRTFGAKDGTEEVAAVVVPNKDLYNEYSDEDVEKIVRADIKTLCQRLTAYKRPNNIILRKEAFERTTTRKIKRKEVQKLVNI